VDVAGDRAYADDAPPELLDRPTEVMEAQD